MLVSLIVTMGIRATIKTAIVAIFAVITEYVDIAVNLTNSTSNLLFRYEHTLPWTKLTTTIAFFVRVAYAILRGVEANLVIVADDVRYGLDI